MSSDKMPKKDNKNHNAKIAIVAGILALGIFASVAVGSQMLNASAQTSSSNSQTPSPITSADDINCAEETSAVHCLDGQNRAYPTGGNSSNDKHFSNSNATAIVSTTGVTTTKVKPDKVSITAGVETNTTATAREAASANAEIMTDVIAALKELGIAEEQISTTNYSLYPVYAYKSQNGTATDIPCIEIYPPPPECQVNQEIVGYKATNSVTVELDVDGEMEAGSVIDAVVESGANTINGVSFFTSQEMQQEIRDSLIQDAIANARHRADVAAAAVGMHVSGVRSIDLGDVQFPFYARSADAATLTSATEFLPGQQEITTNVSITFYMSNGGNAGTSTTGSSSSGQNEEDGSVAAVATARQFILSKLPSLGIEIDNEFDLHSDMVVQISNREYHVDYSVLDTNNDSHDGHIEVVDGKVSAATLDGKSIL